MLDTETHDDLRRQRVGRFLRPDLFALRPYHVEPLQYKIKLDANESPFDLPPDIKAEIAASWAQLPTNRYPDPDAGLLRAAIADRLGVPETWLAIGNGSDELIASLLLSLSRDDATVLAPEPTFSMYRILSQVAGLAYRPVELDAEFRLTATTLRRAIRGDGPHLFFFSYPNNPTGNCWSQDAIMSVLDEPNVLVVCDEAYFEFSGQTLLPQLESRPNLIVLRTFSKAFGMAGLRVGVMAANPGWVECVHKVGLPYNVNAFSQLAATVALRHADRLDADVRVILRERSRVVEALARTSEFEPYPTDANFVLFRVRSGATGVFDRLLASDVLVRNLDRPGPLADCLRVTIGTPEENSAFLTALGIR